MNGRRVAAVAVAACLAGLIAAPLAVDRSILTTDPAIARAMIGLLGSALASVVVAWVGWELLFGGDSGADQPSPLVETPPERGNQRTRAVVGDDFREDVERAARLRADGVASPTELSVWRELRTAAAAAERRATGVSTERARERVETGEWTDDRMAAAFLASEEADVNYPLRHVVYEWLTPAGAFGRRVERAADAIYERYETGDRPEETGDRLPAPNPVPAADAPDVATALLGAELATAVRSAADDGLVALSTADETAARDGLRAAARAVVARAADESERDLVRSGEWTDDRVAAAFLAGPAADVSTPRLQALYERADPHGALDRSVSRTARAILERCERLTTDDLATSAGAARERRPRDERVENGDETAAARDEDGDGDESPAGRAGSVGTGIFPGAADDETLGRDPAAEVAAPGPDADPAQDDTDRRTPITENER